MPECKKLAKLGDIFWLVCPPAPLKINHDRLQPPVFPGYYDMLCRPCHLELVDSQPVKCPALLHDIAQHSQCVFFGRGFKEINYVFAFHKLVGKLAIFICYKFWAN